MSLHNVFSRKSRREDPLHEFGIFSAFALIPLSMMVGLIIMGVEEYMWPIVDVLGMFTLILWALDLCMYLTSLRWCGSLVKAYRLALLRLFRPGKYRRVAARLRAAYETRRNEAEWEGYDG